MVIAACYSLVPPNTSFRSAHPRDASDISRLLVDSFEDFSWYEFPQRDRVRMRYFEALTKRMVVNRNTHFMVVALDEAERIIGFVEAGFLPPPAGIRESIDEPRVDMSSIYGTVVTISKEVSNSSEKCAGTITDLMRDSSNKPIPSAVPRSEVCYLANLAVDKAHRRKGIARRLVDLGSIWARKRVITGRKDGGVGYHFQEGVFVAVEEENTVAKAMYERFGFQVAARPRNRGRVYYARDFNPRAITESDGTNG